MKEYLLVFFLLDFLYVFRRFLEKGKDREQIKREKEQTLD